MKKLFLILAAVVVLAACGTKKVETPVTEEVAIEQTVEQTDTQTTDAEQTETAEQPAE